MSQYGTSIAHFGLSYAQETGDTPPSSRRIYEMVLRGEIPADFINGRWYVHESNKAAAIAAIQRRNGVSSKAA